jgi:hypothetical protein
VGNAMSKVPTLGAGRGMGKREIQMSSGSLEAVRCWDGNAKPERYGRK